LVPHKVGKESFFKLTSSLKEAVVDYAAEFSLLNKTDQTIKDYRPNQHNQPLTYVMKLAP
jgi:hypothetical protein